MTMPIIHIQNERFEVQIIDHHRQLISVEQAYRLVRQLVAVIVQRWLVALMEYHLSNDLAPKWQRRPQTSRLQCPECHSCQIRRKGWRARSILLDSQWADKVNVERPQLKCQECGRHFFGYDCQLGLSYSGRYSSRVKAQAIESAVNLSYQRASHLMPAGPSAATIHRLVNRYVDHNPPSQVDGTLVIDATRIRVWKSPQQQSLCIAHQLTTKLQGRHRRFVRFLKVAGESDFRRELHRSSIKRIVHDGRLDLDQTAEQVGRCRWHLPYTVGFMLYHDGYRKPKNQWIVQDLWKFLTRKVERGSHRGMLVDEWIRRYQPIAPKATGHVRAARKELTIYEEPGNDFIVQTTSHVEREMKEINKRFENGGGWTAKGAENLLWHHQMYRYHESWWKRKLAELMGSDFVLFSKKSQS